MSLSINDRDIYKRLRVEPIFPVYTGQDRRRDNFLMSKLHCDRPRDSADKVCNNPPANFVCNRCGYGGRPWDSPLTPVAVGRIAVANAPDTATRQYRETDLQAPVNDRQGGRSTNDSHPANFGDSHGAINGASTGRTVSTPVAPNYAPVGVDGDTHRYIYQRRPVHSDNNHGGSYHVNPGETREAEATMGGNNFSATQLNKLGRNFLVEKMVSGPATFENPLTKPQGIAAAVCDAQTPCGGYSIRAAGDIHESGTRVRPMPAIQVEPRRHPLGDSQVRRACVKQAHRGHGVEVDPPTDTLKTPYIPSKAPGESSEPCPGVGSKLDMWL